LRQSLAIFETTFGAKHVKVAVLSRALAAALFNKHEPGEAELLIRRALEIYEARKDPLPLHTASTCFELAKLLQFTGRPGEATPYYRRAIAAYEVNLPQDASGLVLATCGLASVLADSGDYTGAKLLYDRALTTAAKTLGPDHPQTVSLKQDMEGLLQRMADSHAN